MSETLPMMIADISPAAIADIAKIATIIAADADTASH